jgi:hypothetical protein
MSAYINKRLHSILSVHICRANSVTTRLTLRVHSDGMAVVRRVGRTHTGTPPFPRGLYRSDIKPTKQRL